MQTETAGILAPARPEPDPSPPDAPARRSALRALLPGVLLVLGLVVLLRHHGVGLGEQLRFAAQLVGVVLVPGVLLWRALRGRSGGLPFDLVGGITLGYTVEIGGYLIGRAAGFPYLHVVVAGGVLAAFLAVPGLRRHWRGGGRPMGARWSWTTAGLAALIMAWETVSFLRPHPLTWPGYANPYGDMPFHQSLVAELRHHLPAEYPTVAGTPLRYHWFLHAEWAAASWSSGIEPFLLTYRLGLVPAIVLLVVAMAVVAQRIVPGRWWTGPLAAALALFAVAPDPAGWSTAAVPTADIPRTMWQSPTQTFGGLLFAGAMLALIDLLRPRIPDRRPGLGPWIAFTLAIAGATGAKATYAPLLIAGLLAVAGIDLLRRRLNGRALAAAGITAAAFGIAWLTMFRGTTAGLFVAPLASLDASLPRTPHPGWTVAHLLAIWALGWCAVIAAAAVLARRRGWADPMLVVSAGIGVAGLAVVLLTKQMSTSQMFFLVSARPYLAVLVVAALVAVAAGRSGIVAAAVALGAGVTLLGDRISPAVAPEAGTVAILWPYALPALAAVAVVLLLRTSRRTAPAAAFAAFALLIGAVVPSTIAYGHSILPVAADPEIRPIPRGAPAAGRWLREHTGTDDLIATNNHCRFRTGFCDARQFWLAAFAERRVLVEGWGFTPPANELAARNQLKSNRIPYWDPARLAANDAAFRRPGTGAVEQLRDRYGVRWLVADKGWPYDRTGLARAAELRYETGQLAIYQIR